MPLRHVGVDERPVGSLDCYLWAASKFRRLVLRRSSVVLENDGHHAPWLNDGYLCFRARSGCVRRFCVRRRVDKSVVAGLPMSCMCAHVHLKIPSGVIANLSVAACGVARRFASVPPAVGLRPEAPERLVGCDARQELAGMATVSVVGGRTTSFC